MSAIDLQESPSTESAPLYCKSKVVQVRPIKFERALKHGTLYAYVCNALTLSHLWGRFL